MVEGQSVQKINSSSSQRERHNKIKTTISSSTATAACADGRQIDIMGKIIKNRFKQYKLGI